MTTSHVPVPVSPFQLKLKAFSIWIETKFECRANRFAFALRMALAAVLFYALFYAQTHWLDQAHGLLAVLHGLLFAWATFWVILQIVRRFHDLGRTGGLFWAVAVPYWLAWRIVGLFHLADKNAGIWWAWTLLAALCGWSLWLTLQLFLKSGTEGPNGYDGRHI
jgi:uncharacterized membrane protein YhaH (DUF805 family)